MTAIIPRFSGGTKKSRRNCRSEKHSQHFAHDPASSLCYDADVLMTNLSAFVLVAKKGQQVHKRAGAGVSKRSPQGGSARRVRPEVAGRTAGSGIIGRLFYFVQRGGGLRLRLTRPTRACGFLALTLDGPLKGPGYSAELALKMRDRQILAIEPLIKINVQHVFLQGGGVAANPDH
jgi:hypothetical protein